MTRKTKSAETPGLETSLAEINELIEQMEQGELTLEQSLERFERGVTLIKHCQKVLESAEQKVQILVSEKEGLQAYENKEEPLVTT